MKPLRSVELQSFLEVELASGRTIVEGLQAPQWGKIERLIILDKPFSSSEDSIAANLDFRDINDPHYWKSEVSDPRTNEVVACRF